MKNKIGIGVCILALVAGLLFHVGRQGCRSTTFAGPSFHSLKGDDVGTIHADLARYLQGKGFAPTASPSRLDSWAGTHTEGVKTSWFVKKEWKGQATHIRVDLDEITVRTSVKWEARGSARKIESAERLAYGTALNLDTWFNGIKATNILPPKMREEKRRDFESHLAEND